MPQAPDFVAGRELVGRAYAHALKAHHGPARTGGTDIEHPTAVARLLDGAGFGEEVVAAAFLHDVVEDTSEGLDQISSEFGDEVSELVRAMTEDDSIEPYEERTEEHRRRVLGAGAAPASIYAADKLARVRSFIVSGEEIDEERLDHFWNTLKLFAGRRPELPFLSELAAELPLLDPEDEEAPGRAPGSPTLD